MTSLEKDHVVGWEKPVLGKEGGRCYSQLSPDRLSFRSWLFETRVEKALVSQMIEGVGGRSINARGSLARLYGLDKAVLWVGVHSLHKQLLTRAVSRHCSKRSGAFRRQEDKSRVTVRTGEATALLIKISW